MHANQKFHKRREGNKEGKQVRNLSSGHEPCLFGEIQGQAPDIHKYYLKFQIPAKEKEYMEKKYLIFFFSH